MSLVWHEGGRRGGKRAALHEEAIRDHVAWSLAVLGKHARVHDATGCMKRMDCKHCQTLAFAHAAIRRMLDFLEAEVPKR